MTTIGSRIKALRIKAKMTQDDLAKAVGATQQQASWWELGKYEPGAYAIIRIAAALGVEPGELLK